MKVDYESYQGFKGADPDEIRSRLRAPTGVQLTEALFEETIQSNSRNKFEPVYTLKDYEYRGKPSAYHIYMNAVDESEAALKLVGSMAHWRKLCKLKWFISGRPEVGFEGIHQWREDLKNRDRSFSKKILIEQAREGNVTAARALEKYATDDKKMLDKNNTVVTAPKRDADDDAFDQLVSEIRK
jgi:hypothetical protein